jgi:hypothetical protein
MDASHDLRRQDRTGRAFAADDRKLRAGEAVGARSRAAAIGAVAPAVLGGRPTQKRRMAMTSSVPGGRAGHRARRVATGNSYAYRQHGRQLDLACTSVDLRWWTPTTNWWRLPSGKASARATTGEQRRRDCAGGFAPGAGVRRGKRQADNKGATWGTSGAHRDRVGGCGVAGFRRPRSPRRGGERRAAGSPRLRRCLRPQRRWGTRVRDLGRVAKLTIRGPSCFGGFGTTVASAGDVNGDDRSDLIVGAPRTSAPGRTQAGTAYVIFGTERRDTIVAYRRFADGFRVLRPRPEPVSPRRSVRPAISTARTAAICYWERHAPMSPVAMTPARPSSSMASDQPIRSISQPNARVARVDGPPWRCHR